MVRSAWVGLVFVAALSAAPKLRPHTPDVTPGTEFQTPWPPVEIAPPRYVCRIAAVTPEGVDVRILNVASLGECRLSIEKGRAWAVPLEYGGPLPSREQVQRLIDADREGR